MLPFIRWCALNERSAKKKNREQKGKTVRWRKLQANSCDSILTHIVKNVAWFDKSGGFVLVDQDSIYEGARTYISPFNVIYINSNTPFVMRCSRCILCSYHTFSYQVYICHRKCHTRKKPHVLETIFCVVIIIIIGTLHILCMKKTFCANVMKYSKKIL